jgi:L-threonylcarbamoyladenylate synthase
MTAEPRQSPESPIYPATPEAIARAAGLIRNGELVAFPTETVYGLGADATNERAVAAVFAAKGRPRFNPLIVHFADASQAEAAARFDARARKLAIRFWPGALTLVLPRASGCPVALLACAGLDTIAVRVPGHPVALALLAAAGRPLAAPSANPSGSVSPTTAAHVAASLGGKVRMILDGGPCRIGVESTVLDLSGSRPVLLRPGGIAAAEIEAEIGPVARGAEAEAGPARSPGMMLRHYAPATPLRLHTTGKPRQPREALLAFGPSPPAGYVTILNLSPAGDLAEAAANLFAMLRELDAGGFEAIAVMPIPGEGLGEAINDRLARAAAPKLAGGTRADQIEPHADGTEG